MAGQRLSWQESFAALKARGVLVPDGLPDPAGIDTPSPGRWHGGLCLRDARHEEVDFADLFLPRILVERCRFHGVSFGNSDLRLSCLFECEFVDCDFGDAALLCTDLRRSAFFACRFARARLIAAELRGATLEHCDFSGADLTGARLDRSLKDTLPLSDVQRDVMVDWRSDDDVGPDDPDQDEE
jgi:hypothetical protein